MFRRSFKGKIILPAVTILVVFTVVLISYVSIKFLRYSHTLIDDKVETNAQFIKFYIENGAQNTRAAAVSMAGNPKAISAIRSRSRELILQTFTSVLDLHHVSFFTITDENGIVLARTHAPDDFGVSAVHIQRNIHDALEGKVSTYFEAGAISKVSVRTGAPVYDSDGTLIGAVSAGVRYDADESVDALKKHFHTDVTIFFGGSRIATTILDKTGQRITGTPLDPHIANIIDNKTEYFGSTDVLGVRYKAFYFPLKDADAEVFAIFALGHPLEELESQTNALIRNIAIISFIGLAVASAVMYWVILTISKSLLDLSNEMNRMEDGTLSIIVNSRSNDEIGHVGKALQKVADTLHKLIDEINITISEHEKGNTGYKLDISSFQGAYQLLASRIVKLSSLGMMDQLTGIPNRRSFDNRLAMEWGRAMRDRSPLSMLMIDVDKFKTYNDTYGHQQGDVVLQTVAKAMLVPIKRGFDFAARWGGEEFVVLLPKTDAEGAAHVAEMVRATIEKTVIPGLDEGQAKGVTISIGVSTLIPTAEESLENLTTRADEALYKAKECGRNRVCRYEERLERIKDGVDKRAGNASPPPHVNKR